MDEGGGGGGGLALLWERGRTAELAVKLALALALITFKSSGGVGGVSSCSTRRRLLKKPSKLLCFAIINSVSVSLFSLYLYTFLSS